MIKSEEVFITNSFGETQKLGEEFARSHPFGLSSQGRRIARLKCALIALYGDLGSGKTTFVQGLAKGLEIKRRIISPTFIIVRNYELGIRNQELGRNNFYHIDLYRMETEKDIESLGIDEIMEDPQNIVAIEWAEKMGNLLPKERIDIRFASISENERRITINIKNQKLNIKNTRFARRVD